MKTALNLALLLLIMMFAGCGERPSATAGSTNASPRTFIVRGSLRELPTDGRSAVIRHEEIPGYMPKMTMTLTLKQPAELRGLVPGDEVEFRLVATEDDHWIESLRRVGRGTVPEARPADPAPVQRELVNGGVWPDAPILDETGATRRFADFRGRAIAFTFIFTRCPLPDFCPRMSKHFKRARELLLTRPGAATNWQFVSLSFDPEQDTPAVLSTYAPGYRGANADRWLFGVLSADTLAAVAPRLDLKIGREGGGFSHNLRTVVLDTRGRIHRQFDGNDWTPEELADALVEAASVDPR